MTKIRNHNKLSAKLSLKKTIPLHPLKSHTTKRSIAVAAVDERPPILDRGRRYFRLHALRRPQHDRLQDHRQSAITGFQEETVQASPDRGGEGNNSTIDPWQGIPEICGTRACRGIAIDIGYAERLYQRFWVN